MVQRKLLLYLMKMVDLTKGVPGFELQEENYEKILVELMKMMNWVYFKPKAPSICIKD